MNIRWKDPFWMWTMVGTGVMALVTIWATASSRWFDQPPKPIGDGMCYESIAYSLASGGGFRENYQSESWRAVYQADSQYNDFLASLADRNVPATGRPPLFPSFIALVYAIVGRNELAFMLVRLSSALFISIAGGLAVGLCAKILLHLKKRHSIVVLGCGCTLLMAVAQRTLRDYTSDFLTEPIALMLTQVLIVLMVFELLDSESSVRATNEEKRQYQKAGTWRSIAGGVIFGLMVLTRSLFIVWLPGVLVLSFICSAKPKLHRIWRLSIFALTALLVCLPWWIHNCMVLGKFMPLGTQGPIALAGGYCDESFENGGNWSFGPELKLRREVTAESTDQQRDQTQIELEIVERSKIEVRHWIKQHVSLLPQLAIKRAVSHWNPYSGRALVWKLAILSGVIWALLYGQNLKWWLVGLPVLSTVVTMGLYETGGRFLVPLYGLLFILGGLGVSGWIPNQRPD